MSLESYIRQLPKVELHVHLEGSIQPELLLILAERNGIELPAKTIDECRVWYNFTDFSHFVEVYLAVSDCIRTVDDIELVTREFLSGQASQNIRYTEVTYTAFTHYYFKGISFPDQLAAVNRGRTWAEREYGVRMGLIIDIPSVISQRNGLLVADWAISGMGDGVVALGLAGPESNNQSERFKAAFDRAREAGLPRVPHAGELEGPGSIWGALRTLRADRIGHGVRCLEDPALVAELRAGQIPLEVCPTSNVCLHVAPSLSQHPLPQMVTEGLSVSLNSDDPALFNTTLTDEYLAVAKAFQFAPLEIEQFVLNALRASFLPKPERTRMEREFAEEFARLREDHLTSGRDPT